MQKEKSNIDLCSNGCGFFGNIDSEGMCSVCWKKTTNNISIISNTSIIDNKYLSISKESEFNIQKNKNRCWSCKKNIGLTGIECRCGFIFCGQHRYVDTHNCSFDYKTLGKVELNKCNPGGGVFNKFEKL